MADDSTNAKKSTNSGDQASNQSNLELNHLVPTVASDGNGVFISNTGVPILTFFQTRRQVGQTLYADVAASIRMNNIDELRQLQRSIEETIETHLKREK
jgi:hypothetical protein